MTPPTTFTVLPPAKLAALARKIAACGDDRNAIVKLASKAVPDEGARRRLYWQLVEQGKAGTEFAVQLVWILKSADRHVRQFGISPPEVPAVAALLALLPESGSGGLGTVLDGWHEDVDRLVFEAWVLDAAPFLAREAEYTPSVRRGLAFVQGRAGHQVSADLRRQVLEELARHQVSFLQVTLPLQRDGQTVELELPWGDPEPVGEVALRFGTPAQWSAALVDAMGTVDWVNPAGVLPVLAQLPLREVGPVLVRHLETGDEWSQVHALLVDRKDPPGALVDAAAELGDRSTASRALRTLYALLAAARFAQGKQAIPPQLVSWIEGLALLDMGTTSESATYGYQVVPAALAQTWVSGLQALPASQVLPLLWRRLDDRAQGYEHLVVPLAAHFDRALFERLSLLDGVDELIEPGTVARIGLPLLAPLASLLDETPVDASSRIAGRAGARQRAFAMAFEHAISMGALPPREFDTHLVFDQMTMKDVQAGGPYDRLLRALPADRRDAIFRREIAADPQGVRPDRLRGVVQLLHLTEDATLVDEAIRRLLKGGYIVPGSIRALGERALEPLLRHLHLAPDVAAALSELEPELTAEAFAKVQAAQNQKTRKPSEAPLAPYPGLSDRSLRALVGKANHLESHQLGQALEKATGDRETRHDLAWHLVQHRLLQPRPSREFISFLSEDVTEARAARVPALLAQLTEPTEGDLFPGWTWGLDALVYRAFALRPELFTDREGLSPAMQRGVAFVARRRGAPVPAEVGEEIMLQLARSQATRGLMINVDVPYLDQGEEHAGCLGGLEDVRTLALLFGSAETWDRLLWQETRRNQWQASRAVSTALAQSPLGELVRLMTTRGWRRMDRDAVSEILATRNDDPGALFAAAQGLSKAGDEGDVRAALATAALRVYGERGLPVPAELGEAIDP